MRVHEIAKLAGSTTAQVIVALLAHGLAVRSASSAVPEDVAREVVAELAPVSKGQLTAPEESDSAPNAPEASDVPDLPDLRTLIRSAFEAAHRTKADQWQTMTTAVLKNRLLNLTDRSFSESAYGFRSFKDLVMSLPDLLEVDLLVRPVEVTLRSEDLPSAAALPIGPGVRVRRDLWNAIINFSTGHRWVWSDGVALPEGDESVVDALILPTLSADELQGWREQFVAEHREFLSESDKRRLEQWSKAHGGTRLLPVSIQHSWNARLKIGVVDRLTSWFASRGEQLPADILVPVQPSTREASQMSASAQSLRVFVTECIAKMTDDELEAIVLPVAAIHRYIAQRRDT